MVISERLRELRESKKLSQGDIEKRPGLRRCYISRVENGHTVPAVETLEKLARALEVPLYQLFSRGGMIRVGRTYLTHLQKSGKPAFTMQRTKGMSAHGQRSLPGNRSTTIGRFGRVGT